MNSWRDSILSNFAPDVNKLTLVADPDGLLSEEKLAMSLRERGFELIEYDDPIKFRYFYEMNYRSVWDNGDYPDMVVIFRNPNTILESLPYDLLQIGRKFSFSLGQLFPNLSYSVIEQLDRSVLDSVFELQQKFSPERLGDNATKDFLLRRVYGIVADEITDDVALLKILLRVHYGNLFIPPTLIERSVQVLRSQNDFQSWPLEAIFPDAKVFYAFLQERWTVFLRRLDGVHQDDIDSQVKLQFLGPANLPFEHHDIRIFIDNLFVEGKLLPVPMPALDVGLQPWIRSGIVTSIVDDENLRISRLFNLVEDNLPTMDSRHSEWVGFALKWAELSSLVHCAVDVAWNKKWGDLCDSINAIFAGWLSAHYSTLMNLPPTAPAMVHQIPRRMARDVEASPDTKVALIVVDGLALDQWVTVRKILQEQDNNLVFRETATFAWIPTITPVSRQAIFSGATPVNFPKTINSTNNEDNLWKMFWEGYNFSRADVKYQRSLGDGDARLVLDALVHPVTTRVVGLVVDKVDKIMHGMQLGSAGMHNQIKLWCAGGFLLQLFGYLLDSGYQVWMTSDHGNLESEGKGRPSEGVTADTRGARVRVYPTDDLREVVAKRFQFARKWQPVGLPQNYFPLVASGRDAFLNSGELTVGHGGISIEEVIVPLIQIERKKR